MCFVFTALDKGPDYFKMNNNSDGELKLMSERSLESLLTGLGDAEHQAISATLRSVVVL